MINALKGRLQTGTDPDPPASLRLKSHHEGRSVQIMYVGAPSAEGPTIARLHNEFLPAHKLVAAGRHHEIYLTDPSRTAPEMMRTVLRQPVRASE
ncbi:MAG: GyrI-like domain-containing protein [Phycisphaerae bacterium]